MIVKFANTDGYVFDARSGVYFMSGDTTDLRIGSVRYSSADRCLVIIDRHAYDDSTRLYIRDILSAIRYFAKHIGDDYDDKEETDVDVDAADDGEDVTETCRVGTAVASIPSERKLEIHVPTMSKNMVKENKYQQKFINLGKKINYTIDLLLV